MAIYTDWDALFNAFTSLLLAVMGGWILTLKPRSARTLALGVFALVHGVYYVLQNLWDVTQASVAEAWFQYGIGRIGLIVPGIALLVLAGEFLSGYGPPGRRAVHVLWVAVTGSAALSATFSDPCIALNLPACLGIRFSVGFFVLAFSSMPLLFALAFRRPPPAGEGFAPYSWAVLGMGILPWPAMYAALSLYEGNQPPFDPSDFLAFALVAAAGVAWLWNTTLPPREGRRARNAALLTFGLLTFGLIDAAVLGKVFHYSRSDGPFFGIARLATTVVLLVAITRHSILGVDARIRWGISKSTVAGMLLATIFVASEGAQAAFGQDKQWLGLLAGGAVVFAIAPLQRAAERLAKMIVPSANASAMPTPSSGALSSAERAYLAAARLALRDRRLTRDEEMELALVADELGLSPSQVAAAMKAAEEGTPARSRGDA